MKAELINPFVTASKAILKQFFPQMWIEQKQILITKPSPEEDNIMTAISINGDMNGTVIFNLPVATAVEIASTMNNKPLSIQDKLTYATIKELTNIIVGIAVSQLHEKGYRLDISTPFTLDNTHINNTNDVLKIVFDSSAGPFKILIVTP